MNYPTRNDLRDLTRLINSGTDLGDAVYWFIGQVGYAIEDGDYSVDLNMMTGTALGEDLLSELLRLGYTVDTTTTPGHFIVSWD